MVVVLLSSRGCDSVLRGDVRNYAANWIANSMSVQAIVAPCCAALKAIRVCSEAGSGHFPAIPSHNILRFAVTRNVARELAGPVPDAILSELRSIYWVILFYSTVLTTRSGCEVKSYPPRCHLSRIHF